MTIVVITEGMNSREGLSTIFPASGNNFVFVRTAAEAIRYPEAGAYIDLDFVNEPDRIASLSRLLPAPVLVNSMTATLAEIGFPFVRINGWPGFLERDIHELAIADGTMKDQPTILKDQLTSLYEQLGRSYRLVPDTPGMISGRILATIINEAWYTLEEEVSTMEEIDIAMKLGTNYPMGPFEWGRSIGLEKIASLLIVLSRNNDRYTPSLSLLKAVELLKYD